MKRGVMAIACFVCSIITWAQKYPYSNVAFSEYPFVYEEIGKSADLHINYVVSEQIAQHIQFHTVNLVAHQLDADTGITQLLGVWDTLPSLNQDNYAFTALETVEIDSIRFTATHINTSLEADTLQLKLFKLDAQGFPNLQQPIDTFQLMGSQLAIQGSITFPIQKSYSGLSGIAYQLVLKGSPNDTVKVLAAFPFQDTCATLSQPLPIKSAFYPSAFAYDAYYQQQLPNSGGDFYFDCNLNGVYDSLIDGANPLQLIYADLFITAPHVSLTQPSTHPTVRLYPNPSTDNITIESTAPLGAYRCFNIHGQIVYTGVLHYKTEVLPVSGWPTGIYYLQFLNNQSTYPFHVVH